MKAVVEGMGGITLSHQQEQALGLAHFDLVRVIGRGSYAKVLLVRLKKSDQVYAMKVVKKELVHDDEVRHPTRAHTRPHTRPRSRLHTRPRAQEVGRGNHFGTGLD